MFVLKAIVVCLGVAAVALAVALIDVFLTHPPKWWLQFWAQFPGRVARGSACVFGTFKRRAICAMSSIKRWTASRKKASSGPRMGILVLGKTRRTTSRRRGPGIPTSIRTMPVVVARTSSR
jgi:uncharacterized membrane protein YedE/YeeE